MADPSGYATIVDGFIHALSDFTPDELRQGWRSFVVAWHWKTWPVAGLLHKHCQEHRALNEPYVPKSHWLPPPSISREERQRVGDQLTRWRKLMESGEFWEIGHEEAYDAVYRGEMGAAHKADMLEKIRKRAEKQQAKVRP